MRAPSTICFASLIVLIAACGRSPGQEESVPSIPETVETQPQKVPQRIIRTPAPRSLGQPRLSRLTANTPSVQVIDIIPPQNQLPPTATFSQYDGRLPGDARVPSDINSVQRTPASPVRQAPPQKDLGGASRDIVDIGLNRPVIPVRSDPKAKPSTQVASISRAPAPKPRPVSATPTPVQRPTATVSVVPPPPEPVAIIIAPVEPLLPSAPSIALRVPGLSSPSIGIDAPPTGLPVLRSVEQAVPLGTLPASLGIANIESGEAALPIADQLEQSVADDSGTLTWTQAASLIRAGEVETAADIGQFEVLLLLCSGRGVVTIQPTPTALADLEKPKVVCGKSVTLTSQ